MEKKEIIEAILSKDKSKLAEAKTSIKGMLSGVATQFKKEATIFAGKTIFESASPLFGGTPGQTKVPNSVPEIKGHIGFDPTLAKPAGEDKTGHVFKVGTKADDANTGKVGEVKADPYNNGNPTVPPASFTASSGKIDTSTMFMDQLPDTDGIKTTVGMLTGMEKGA